MLQKTFRYLVCVIICTCGLCSELRAISFAKQEYRNYADCKISVSADVNRELAFNPSARYKEILTQLQQEAETKLETYKNTPLTKAIRETHCTINYRSSEIYNCEVGQKPVDCMPSMCWAIRAGIDTFEIKRQAEENYTEERIKTECTKYEDMQPQPQQEAPKKDNNSAAAPESNNDADRAEQDRKAKEKEEEKKRKAEEKARKQKEKQEKERRKEQEKQAECAAKNPPQVAKKNAFGKWTCADSNETKQAREEKKQNDKNLKAFWDDMDDLDKAFLKRVQELKKQGGKK